MPILLTESTIGHLPEVWLEWYVVILLSVVTLAIDYSPIYHTL